MVNSEQFSLNLKLILGYCLRKRAEEFTWRRMRDGCYQICAGTAFPRHVTSPTFRRPL